MRTKLEYTVNTMEETEKADLISTVFE